MSLFCIFKKCKFPVSQLQNLVMSNSSRLSTSSTVGAQQKIDVLNVKVNYDKVGNGSHPIILLPGALGFIDSDFAPILNKFSDKFTVVGFDPPGYGKSRPPDRDFSGGVQFFHRDAEVANALMKKLGFEKYSILGWSDGANMGMILSAKFPQNVQKLVIWGGNSYISEEDVQLYENVRDLDKWSDKMKQPFIKMYGKEYFQKLWNQWTDTYVIDIYKNGGANICKEALPNIKCPTFILHGAKDPMVPEFHAQYLRKNISNTSYHVFPDGKHNIHLRYADEFVKLVEEFLIK